MKTKREKAIDALMTKQDAKKEIVFSSTIITYYSEARKMLACAIFEGRSFKPNWHYLFRSEKERSEWIEAKRQNAIKCEERNKELKKEWNDSKKDFKPGVILYSSWGYDQTNIDFYQVLDRKGDTVILQEIGQDRTTTGFMSGDCTPDPSVKIGESFRKRITKYGTIKLTSFSSAWIWNGDKKYWSSYA